MSKTVEEHVLKQYKLVQEMGSGAYGHVWEVEEKKTARKYALKKVFDAFRNSVDAQRTYREVEVLQQLNHENIVQLCKVIKSKNKKDLYLVFEFMEADLHSVVGTSILSKMHHVYIFFQIFKAVHYLHSSQLIHRDLKPSNVLLNSECCTKLCDFGLVRSLNKQTEEEVILSEEVATKWYRAPELLLGSRSYCKPVDIWSIGCIIAQLLIGKPLFAGSSTLNQLEKMLEYTGKVSKEDIESLESPVAEQLISQIKVRKKAFKEFFGTVDPEFQSLLQQLLEFNPNKRITAEQALKLPLFDEFAQEIASIKTSSTPVIPNIDDNIRMGVRIYRDKIYDDIDRRYNVEPLKNKVHELFHLSKKETSKIRVHSHGKPCSKKKYSHSNKQNGTASSVSKAKSTTTILKGAYRNPYLNSQSSSLNSLHSPGHHSTYKRTFNSKHELVSKYSSAGPQSSKILKKHKPTKLFTEKKQVLRNFHSSKPKTLKKLHK